MGKLYERKSWQSRQQLYEAKIEFFSRWDSDFAKGTTILLLMSRSEIARVIHITARLKHRQA